MSKYSKINKNSFKGEVLLYSRREHVNEIAKRLFDTKLINNEYIDEQLKIEYLQKKKEYIANDELRFEYINRMLQAECSKMTSRLINELTQID